MAIKQFPLSKSYFHTDLHYTSEDVFPQEQRNVAPTCNFETIASAGKLFKITYLKRKCIIFDKIIINQAKSQGEQICAKT